MTAGKSKTFVIALGTSLALAAAVFAQQQRAPDQSGQRRDSNKPVINEPSMQMAGNADAQLATCLIGDNQGEIALGKLAQEHAKDGDVKQFAERMVRDHEQFVQQLQRFARPEGERSNVRTDNRTATGAPASAVSATGQPMEGRGVDFVAIHEQIGKRCLEMFETDLKEKQGNQFDKCYIGQQIGAHMHVLAELEVIRSHVSPDLSAVLDKGIETTKSHLAEAQKIAKALEKS